MGSFWKNEATRRDENCIAVHRLPRSGVSVKLARQLQRKEGAVIKKAWFYQTAVTRTD
jgi:hypothetical protein